MRNEQPGQKGLFIVFSDIMLYVRLATDAKQAVIWVDDAQQICYVELNEEDKSYTVEFYLTQDNNCRHVVPQGVTDSNYVALAQIDGTLYRRESVMTHGRGSWWMSGTSPWTCWRSTWMRS